MRTISNKLKYRYGLMVGVLSLVILYFALSPEVDNLVREEEEDKVGMIMGRSWQEFITTRDPKTNTIPTYRLLHAYEVAQEKRKLKAAGSFPIYWEERGPSNVGGRTRGLLIDSNNPSRVLAAGVSGGLWITNNIDAVAPVWTRVDDLFENLAISTMAQHPNTPNIMYFGTGEGHSIPNNAANCFICGVQGLGIWESTDSGNTWELLDFTFNNPTFSWVNKIVVDGNGWIYAATRTGGIQLSTDGGDTFNQVLGIGFGANTNMGEDIEIAANGDIYASMQGDGIYQFPNGGTNWGPMNVPTPNNNFGRIELAVAPSDPLTVYAAYESTVAATNGQCMGVFSTVDGGTNWNSTILNGPNIGAISWWCLTMAVDPMDPLRVWIGGVNLFHSFDGGSVWNQIPAAQNVHVDHHAIVYRQNNSNEMVFGNDGGVYRSTNGAAMVPNLINKNTGFNVTQFYSIALNPGNGSDELFGGTQDNGTQLFGATDVSSSILGADGGFAHIDQDNALFQIASQQNGGYFLSTAGSGGAFNNIVPANNNRLFINPSDYDDANNVLYFSDVGGNFGRVTDVGGTNTSTFEASANIGTGQATAITVSPNTANRVFMGTSAGSVFRIDNANMNGSVTITNLGTPGSGLVTSISVENGDDQHLLITYGNYGVVSVFESTDGGTMWMNVEGDLPDMPVRWSMFHPFDADQAMLATELGVWTTGELIENGTVWMPTNGYGLANVRVDMLQYRSSDNLVGAATYGRGIFVTDYFDLLANCPPNLNLSGVISPGIYIAEDVITSDGTVEAGTAVIYQAGEMIVLEPDFTAERRSDFWALILPCNPGGSFAEEDQRLYFNKPDEAPEVPTPDEAERQLMNGDDNLLCYPNPSETEMTIDLYLSASGRIKVIIMNARGQLVETLTEGFAESGLHRFRWEASKYESGLYLIQLQTKHTSITERVFVVR